MNTMTLMGKRIVIGLVLTMGFRLTTMRTAAGQDAAVTTEIVQKTFENVLIRAKGMKSFEIVKKKKGQKRGSNTDVGRVSRDHLTILIDLS